MALEGSLKEFSLADILQLIYYQRKTGVLTIESRLDKVRILFHEGRIVSVESKKRAEDGRIGRILVKKGLLEEPRLKEIIAEQKASGERLGHLLIKKGLIEKELLREILEMQITETITQIFSWKDGRYEFKPQGVPIDREFSLDLDTQHILMEGLRIVDEWTVLEGKITLTSVFKRTDKPAEGLEEIEEELLPMIDGHTDVATIADLIGRGNFEVSKAMLGLLEKGLIEPSVEAPAPEEVKAPTAPEVRTTFAKMTVTASLLIALALAVLVSGRQKTDLGEVKASEAIDSLRFKIETFRYENGTYPKSLAEINAQGQDPWGHSYVYSVTDRGFLLYSVGPDGVPNTVDDIY